MVLHGVSQTTPTLLSHKTTLYSVELTSAEMLEVQAREGEVNGIGGERCILETRTLSELTSGEVEVDWGTLGMILSVLR
jgi:hypothetical protein